MPGSSAIENDLMREMKKVGVKLSREMLSKCMAMVTNHNLTPQHIANVWDVFSLNSQAENLTSDNWSSFRVALDREIAKTPLATSSSKKKAAAVVSRSAMGKRTSSSTGASGATPSAESNASKKVKRERSSPQPDSQLEQIVNGNIMSSPQKNSDGDESSSLALVTPPKSNIETSKSANAMLYSQRKNAGETALTYNPHNLAPVESNVENGRTCVISQPFASHLSGSYKYMTDGNRHQSLDRHLQSMMEKMIESHGISRSSEEENGGAEDVDYNKDSKESATFEDVGVLRQSQQTNIGRICNVAHDGKLNETSLLLEGTRHGSNGARIELVVKDVSNYCLFQGQIVAVKGVNSNGRKMVATQVMEGLDCKGQEDMDKSPKEMFGTHGLKVYAVAGPYTTSSDLKYEPLADLMVLVAEEKPDVVLMMGPFVDMRNEIVNNGEDLVLEYEGGAKAHVCYEQFFAAKIAAEIENMYEEDPDLKTQFILVPSMDDAVAEPVYPQPPLENPLEKVIQDFPVTEDLPYGSLGLNNIETVGGKRLPKNAKDRRVHLVPNPCTIKINEVTIGFTSLDAYMHMSTESITKLPVGNRLHTLAEQFIKQRSYYPIFPAPSGNGKDFNLDVTKMEAFSMPVQPDILILPSLLTCTATCIAKGTTFVNPGHLVKGSYGGTYAILDIHPMKSEILEKSEEEEISHSVSDRIRVEVRRI